MDDLISRAAAIDVLFELYEYQRDIDPTEAADLVRQGIYLAEKKIEQLPSTQRMGKWINDKGLYRCSACNELWCDWWASVIPIERMNKLMHYCPHCGARMVKREEE